ncbi:MAG: assimilatory sulfite reductase (NADPH) flavoprotein subunit [Prolixibacteraceae bacterium]|jgi:sulfite reductase (NADPH) flavoprotein alpha-component|nr:assimilatory sulfite reductase (NADPH) flavoprotein subunit [Prolixibacteraceae bacterium]
MINNVFPSPLGAEQFEKFRQLTDSLNEVQLAWISGYLSALTAQNGVPVSLPVKKENINASAIDTITILYGSRTGNGKEVAMKAVNLTTEIGLTPTLKSMDDYKPRDLQSEKNLLVIVSTHGEGEPPFAAKELHEFIFGKRAPKLDNVKFAVLALGDSSYLQFCQTGKDFDLQMEKLGAKRLVPLVCCDVDFQDTADQWLRSTLPAFAVATVGKIIDSTDAVIDTSAAQNYSKKNPYYAELLDKVNLHGRGSERQTLHIELEADLPFEPGDSAGIMPVNNSELVNEVLSVTGLNPDELIEIKNSKISLFDSLQQEFELSKITVDVIKRYLEFAPDEKLAAIYQSQEKLQDYLFGRDIADLFSEFPAKLSAQDFIHLLRPLQPRLYSIASSPKANPGELHLAVGVVEYQNGGRIRRGTCSGYLSEIDGNANKIPVFIEKNPNFRLPEKDETPIIMVGAGTGIAPYRAFVQHREQSAKPGKSWLIFGNRNFETEFLYQTDWQKFMKSGALSKMDVAFSRDTDKRVYVQHKLEENAAEVYRWLEDGAHFYICGDMKKMATDVQNTLVSIVENQGTMSKDKATVYVNKLQKERRLQLDVY